VTPDPAGDGSAWYQLSAEDAAKKLGVEIGKGLPASEASARLAKDGPNALPAEKPTPEWRRFLNEYRSFMQIVLVAAAVVSLVIAEWSTAVLLFILTVVNAVVGLREEGKAESAMNALKSLMKATARVRRDGSEAQIGADQVVPGDVVLLAAGDQVPADGRVVAASSLQIDESSLTGESTPAAKQSDALAGKDLTPGDQHNMAFMNCPVTHGSGTMIVTSTGKDTEVGKISGLLKAAPKEETPLMRQLTRMTQWIAVAALVTMVVMFALGLGRGQSWRALFVSAVALAIAAIPEALPTVVEVILSLGAVGLAKRNAIVKDLGSVETLGSTSAINSDKTGTLTMNQMTVVELWDTVDQYTVSGTGYELDGKVQHVAGNSTSADQIILPFIVASDAKLVDGKVVGDPTEGALLVLAHKAELAIDGTRAKYPRAATLPFDPATKLMAVFAETTDDKGGKVVRCFVKGAAPAVLERTTHALAGGAHAPFDDARKKNTQDAVTRMEGEGLRVMAAATCDVDAATFDPKADLLGYVKDLEMASLVGMIDPPRESSAAAVKAAQDAHIRVRMVTGDDVITGAAIARKLGIPGEAMLGADFAALGEDERLKKIDDIGVVGRVAPEHKALLAQTLRKKGDVVAMTGDGVNDAPAIKIADIGIAMGTGTEVAKSAGRMILEDDNFATIVFAVEQGRKLYDNLMKYVRFILITLVAFVISFLGASLLNIALGQPFTPVQILWINFLIDTPLGIALGFDAETPGLMKRHPRPRHARILNARSLLTSIPTGTYMAVAILFLIHYGANVKHSAALGITMALTMFAWSRIVCTYESRSVTATAISVSSFECRAINLISLGEIVLAFLVAEWDVLNRLLGTTRLTARELGVTLAFTAGLFVLWEAGKLVARLTGHGEKEPAHDAEDAPSQAAGDAPAAEATPAGA
jgi:P-type Ca2+ transporter type 2C